MKGQIEAGQLWAAKQVRHLTLGLSVLSLCVVVSPLGTALAGSAGIRQMASLTFSKAAAGTSSGLQIRIDYVNPDDPSAKPPAVRRVAVRLRRGSRINTDVPQKCGASDAQLTAQGADACPAGSQVGTGTITVDSGVSGPGRILTADAFLLNNTDELIILSIVRGSGGARVVTRSRIVDGHVLVTRAPFLPGTPPDGAAIDTVHEKIPALRREVGGHDRAYITTPQHCSSGDWTNRIRFTYADGVTQMTTNPSSCRA